VPGWVTVLGRINCIDTNPGTLVDSAGAIQRHSSVVRQKLVLAVVKATAGEERRVLHNSRPCDQD